MTTRLVHVVFVAALCVLPAAQATECEAINAALEQIGNLQTKLVLPNARDCYGGPSMYSCDWVMPSIAKAEEDFRSTSNELAACIPGAKLTSRDDSATIRGSVFRALVQRKGARVTVIFSKEDGK
jgi:hypothetical protein